MKLKLLEIVNSVPAFQELLGKQLPIQLSYKLSLTIKKLDSILTTYNEQVNAIGNDQSKLTELNLTEVDVDIEKINIEKFGNIEVTPKSLLAISFMLE